MEREDQFTRSDGDKTLIAGISGGALTYLPGDIVDHDYRLIKLLGRGGVGAVFSCLKISLDRKYALKLLAGTAMTGDVWNRFQSEAKILARLNHPGIVRVHNMGIDRQQCPYYIMDLLEGESLSIMLRRTGRLSLDQTLDLFTQIAEALGSAHSKGIVHRDIKPSNVMLVSDTKTAALNAILVDFGLARSGNSEYDVQSQTATGHIFGTPAYMSPEQCQGEKVDQRSDIYSFGISLYQALTGSPPFMGSNPLAVLMMHQNKNPPPLPVDESGKPYPQALQVAIDKMLDKRPSDRYQNMTQIIHDFERIKAGKPIFAQGLSDATTPDMEAAKKALDASQKAWAARKGRKGGRYSKEGKVSPEADLLVDHNATFSLAKKTALATLALLVGMLGALFWYNIRTEKKLDLAYGVINRVLNIKSREIEPAPVNGKLDEDQKAGNSTEKDASADSSTSQGLGTSPGGSNLGSGDNHSSGSNHSSGPDHGSQVSPGEGSHPAPGAGSQDEAKAGTDKSTPSDGGKTDLYTELRSPESMFLFPDADDPIMSNAIYPWKKLKALGASKAEVKSLSPENLVAVSDLRKKAEKALIALQADPKWMSQKFHTGNIFHFPKDIFIGSISIDNARPVLAGGDIKAPSDKDAFLYLLAPAQKMPQLVDKFGPTDLTGITLIYRGDKELKYAIDKVLTWKRLKDLWFYNPLCRIIAEDTDDWGEAKLQDADLFILNRFSGLRSIGLCFPISGPAILRQPFLKKIEGLALKRINNIEPLIDALPHLDNLKEIYLNTADTTDAQLETLAKMKNLQKLSILRGHLTLASFDIFKQMKGLKELHLDRNDWTAAQKQNLKASLPNCKVVFEKVISTWYWPMFPADVARYQRPDTTP